MIKLFTKLIENYLQLPVFLEINEHGDFAVTIEITLSQLLDNSQQSLETRNNYVNTNQKTFVRHLIFAKSILEKNNISFDGNYESLLDFDVKIHTKTRDMVRLKILPIPKGKQLFVKGYHLLY